MRKVALLAMLTLMSQAAGAQTGPAEGPAGFAQEFLAQLNDLESKTLRLAEAVPQEKYSWRPGEGVRSVGQVYAHIAAGNYAFSRPLGVKAPAGLDLRNIEKITDKATIVAALKKSFADIRAGAKAMTAADLDKNVKFFGNESSGRDLLFRLSVHISEHLGQSIAYARTVGIVPPWTADRQARQAQPAPPAKK